MIYVGGMLHRPTILKDREAGGPLPTLIPLYVEFKAKKCHQCSRPIVNYKHGLFCSNIFQGLTNLDHACYKFVCKDCLGSDQWDFCKNNLLYKCACCKGQCPPTSFCSTLEQIRDNPMFFVDREIYWYHWRGKRSYVRAKITQYDKIRKQHKILNNETKNSTKLYLEKESFFDIGIIPKGSQFWRYLKKSSSSQELLDNVNFKELVESVTFENLLSRGRTLYDYVKARNDLVRLEE